MPADRFPTVCDSCCHYARDLDVCEAFPDGVPLDPMAAELHDEPRPNQDNDIVWTLARGEDARRSRATFDKFRALVIGDAE